MGTNYYRVPTEEEVDSRARDLAQHITEMPLTPALCENEFRYITSEEKSYFSQLSPWDIFTKDISIHLGKRSSGWKFCWNFNDKKFYSNKEELLAFIRSGRVVDEYGTEKDVEEFIEMALSWGEPDGLIFDEHYVIEHFDKTGLGRPFTAKEEYYEKIIDGLRVSTSTDFC